MGYTVDINCKICGVSERLNIGQGLKDFKEDLVISYFSEAVRPEVKKAIEESDLFNYERVISFCENCQKYSSTPRLTYFIKNEKKMIYDVCQCGGKVSLVADTQALGRDKVTLRCLKCGDILEAKETGMYD